MKPDNVFNNELSSLYKYYNETIKPMLINVESRYEYDPLPLYNEIRAFNDHISRCYSPDVTNDYRVSQLGKARIHLDRLLLDLYKYLNVYFHDKVEKFEKDTRNIDLASISDGVFYIEYKNLRKKAIQTIREAKKIESTNKPESFEKFQEAYNIYEALDSLIDDNVTSVCWAKARYSSNLLIKIVLWVITAVIAGIISNLTGLFPYREWISSIFKIT
jgi:hypothetical protein